MPRPDEKATYILQVGWKWNIDGKCPNSTDIIKVTEIHYPFVGTYQEARTELERCHEQYQHLILERIAMTQHLVRGYPQGKFSLVQTPDGKIFCEGEYGFKKAMKDRDKDLAKGGNNYKYASVSGLIATEYQWFRAVSKMEYFDTWSGLGVAFDFDKCRKEWEEMEQLLTKRFPLKSA